MSDEISNEHVRGLCADVFEDVRNRQTWLTRQSTWYQMRHEGLRRRNKPWPNAADLHFPLSDNAIEKLKPFYCNQLFGMEVIAQFMAKTPDVQPMAQDLGYWFDYKLKQKTNLENAIMVGIDKMLMAGHVPVKVGWDADKKEVFFDAIEPTHCIVPDNTENIQDADRLTIVHHLTPGAYKRDSRFTRKDPDFIKRITGNGNDESGNNQLRDEKSRREGITHGGKNDSLIIIWEIWEHADSGDWMVHFVSPLATELPVRASQKNPFLHGMCPVVRFDSEIKDKSYYGSRGVPEKLAAFEAHACKIWNDKSDCMTLSNRPLFTSTIPIPNAGNLSFKPGQILPGGVTSVQMGRPPIDFGEELNMTRALAEQSIGSPDFGVGNSNDKNDSRTATEVQAIGVQAGAGVELRSRVFRIGLGELLQMAWETIVQYDFDAQFYIGSEVKKLPLEVLKTDAWKVKPNGSSETWNKPQMLQKAIMRKQLFAGAPWVNQPELDKSVLELDDPRLVARLFMDPNQKQQSEYDAEAQIIPTLMLGLPIQSNPGEDQVVRIKCLMDFMHQRGQLGFPVEPLAVKAIMARIQLHLAALSAKDPKAAMGLAKAIDAEAQGRAPGAPAPSSPAAPDAQPAPPALTPGQPS